jgi:hypothetical protein
MGIVIHTDMGIMKFTIPSLVNPTSSVNRMLATKCVYSALFEKPWQNTTLA